MNRLAPLIRRPTAIAAAIATPAVQAEASDLADDLRFFAMAWLGGFVFFGTLFA